MVASRSLMLVAVIALVINAVAGTSKSSVREQGPDGDSSEGEKAPQAFDTANAGEEAEDSEPNDIGPGSRKKEADRPAVSTLFPDGLLMLVMIVKDEDTSIEAVLRSAMPHCDTWYIMDTGSTDQTIPIIHRVMKEMGKKGVLDEHPFVDFATTRNIALERSGAGAMYKLFIDGDWFIEGAKELRSHLQQNVLPYRMMMTESQRGCAPCRPCFDGRPALDGFKCSTKLCQSCAPVLMMRLMLGSLDYYVPRVIRGNSIEQFEGVVHEVIGPYLSPKIPRDAFIIVNATDTNREHSRQRWHRDEKLLEAELAKNPETDTRSAFYLAQTYELIDKPLEAYNMNMKRVAMGGWKQERFVALQRAGDNALAAGLGFEKAKNAWLEAYAMDPKRIETIYRIAHTYKEQGNLPLCGFYAIMASRVPYPPPSSLFIQGSIYHFDRHDLLGICAWYVDEFELGFNSVLKALKERPTSAHTIRNLAYYKGKVAGVEDAMLKYKLPETHTEL
eukprot:m.263092 g.263092  ORF g.263092 m.263092 type:complete len:502 (+) comp48545_c0_seq1:219-1724(+)